MAMKHDNVTTRREFLQIGTTALTGAALSSPTETFAQSADTPTEGKKLIQRTLGRTGLRVPVVSMGSCYSIELVRTALERGIVYVHTSSDYADGNHERLLGKAVRGLPRDSFVVATTPDLPYRFEKGQGMSNDVGIDHDPKLLITSLENSLGGMGLDYIDIYYLGSVGRRESVLHEPYIESFERLKKDGKIRFAGVTTHANEPAMIKAATESKFWDLVLTAFNFRQTHGEKIRVAIHAAAEAGLGVVAMKTQAGVYWDKDRRRKINMTAALKWVLQDENIHTTIPAFSNFEELEEDLSIMENLELTRQELQDLELGGDLGFSGHYCQQCGQCLQQCPGGIDVPTLMRGYMYAFGHRHPERAKHLLRSWSPADVVCTTCGTCLVECALGFEVGSRAAAVAGLLDTST